jgi:putative acetyltransferase
MGTESDGGGDGAGAVTVSLRAARPGDGAAVASVFGLARAEMHYLPVLHTQQEHVAFFSDVVLPFSKVTLAVIGDATVGFSAATPGWLDHLYVVPAKQGHGVGAALLERAKSENPDGLSLWVFEANVRAIAFYRRADFVEVLRTDGRDNEEQVADVQMRWAGTGP